MTKLSLKEALVESSWMRSLLIGVFELAPIGLMEPGLFSTEVSDCVIVPITLSLPS